MRPQDDKQMLRVVSLLGTHCTSGSRLNGYTIEGPPRRSRARLATMAKSCATASEECRGEECFAATVYPSVGRPESAAVLGVTQCAPWESVGRTTHGSSHDFARIPIRWTKGLKLEAKLSTILWNDAVAMTASTRPANSGTVRAVAVVTDDNQSKKTMIYRHRRFTL